MTKEFDAKLKPCPFCGDADPHVYEVLDSDDGVYQYLVECAACSASVYGLSCISDSRAMESAIETWNQRTGERTCHVEYIDEDSFHLSCGHEAAGCVSPSFCPCCGAKVVEAE